MALKKWFPVFVLPTLAAFTIVFAVPFILGLGLSFTEFTTVLDIVHDCHLANATKDRTGLFGGDAKIITRETGAMLLRWLESGEEQLKPPERKYDHETALKWLNEAPTVPTAQSRHERLHALAESDSQRSDLDSALNAYMEAALRAAA